MAGPSRASAVVLEVGQRRVFADVVGWPGWCRAAKDEDGALEALAAYVARYRVVTDEAGVRFPARVAAAFDVVERVAGNATTDFGAPGVVADVDRRPTTRAQAQRAARLVEASWAVFDRVAAGAPPTLRKGPRGGGRDRDAIVDHVLGADAGYARQIGVRQPVPGRGDDAAMAQLRAAIIDVLRRPSDGQPHREKGWPPRYAARRIAWHVLDHAWEIEDRS